MSEIEELKKRVAELEAEVARLKAQPAQQHHYHYNWPWNIPQPTTAPVYPQYPNIWYISGSSLQG